MVSERISRGRFLTRCGMVVGAAATAHALPDPLLRQLGGRVWLPAAAASGTCFDPIPDPLALGWTKEGTEAHTPGSPLRISDTRKVGDSASPVPFCTFYCDASSLFGSEITLTPTLTLSDVSPDADGNTGVHGTINDGVTEIRAVVFEVPTGFDVRLATGAPGFTRGLPVAGQTPAFTLKRLSDGTGVLQLGGDEIVLGVVEQPGSSRVTKTIEFGTYGVPAAATTAWTTLGLPGFAFPATLFLSRMQLRASSSANEKVQVQGSFTLDPASDGINPEIELVSLSLTSVGTTFYSKEISPGGFSPRTGGWSLNDSGRAQTGIQSFEIDATSGGFTITDTKAAIGSRDYSNVTVDLRVGNDQGTATTPLVQTPAGSGNWSGP
jgi:hypothetical protein